MDYSVPEVRRLLNPGSRFDWRQLLPTFGP
jgi:hypothetical protein